MPRDEGWIEKALCREPGVDPDLWTPDTDKQRRLALHLCRVHCIVKKQCERYTDKLDRCVVAGTYYPPSRRVGKGQDAASRCDRCVPTVSVNCGTYGRYATEVANGLPVCDACTQAYEAFVADLTHRLGRPLQDVVDEMIAGYVTIPRRGLRPDGGGVDDMGALLLARVEAIRQLAYKGLSDPAIAEILSFSHPGVRHIRIKHHIPAGNSPAIRRRIREENPRARRSTVGVGRL